MIGIIVFIDIKKSVLLFNKYNTLFYNKIKKLDKLIKYYIKSHKGILIKSMGDSWMIYFDKDNEYEAFVFSLKLQKYLYEKKFSIKNKRIYIRIGCSIDVMMKSKQSIQNCKMDDYYGKNVNIASRLESQISEPGGFVINNFNYNKLYNLLPKVLKDYLDTQFTIKDINYKKINFKNINNKKSGKLLDLYIISKNKYNYKNIKIKSFIPNIGIPNNYINDLLSN